MTQDMGAWRGKGNGAHFGSMDGRGFVCRTVCGALRLCTLGTRVYVHTHVLYVHAFTREFTLYLIGVRHSAVPTDACVTEVTE